MRIATLIAFAGLVTVQLAFSKASKEETPCERERLQPTADLCLDDHAEKDGLTSVDDDALQQHLEQQGGTLIKEGKATNMQALVKQLGIERCELDLALANTPFENESQLFAHAKESVVVVSSIYKCKKCDEWHATTATGFVISSSGAIVTNYHVVNNPDKETIVVMTADGQVVPVKRILAASKPNDLAVIQVDADGLVPLPIAAEPEPVGSRIGVISHPSQRFYCYTNGIVSRYMRMEPNDGVVDGMTITADYARGSSGAPVLNMQGQVVGIVQSTNSIYYSVVNGRQKNLQMVFKRCIPAASLLRLIARVDVAAK